MLRTNVSERDTQLITAISMLLVCLSAGHLVLAGTGSVIVFGGVVLGQQARSRKVGKSLFLSGLLVILIGMIFSTGFELGKDMADRDALHAASSVGIVPR